MAKRKHSTALFEVITKSRTYGKPPERVAIAPKVFSSAGRWLKNHLHAEPIARTPAAAIPSLDTTGPVPIQATLSSQLIAPSTLTLVQTPPEEIDPAPALDSHDVNDAEYQTIPAGAKVSLAVDHDSRQISLRMTYTTALIAAAALITVVGLSIIVLQHVGRNSALLLAEKTTDKIRAGPAQGDVLNVSRYSNSPIPPAGVNSIAPNNTASQVNANAPDNRAPVPSVAGDGKRYIGLNYVIVQSYPLAEEKMAKEAAALLNKEGVSCTVETGVKGYLPITVVGLQGFERQSSFTFKAYIQRIQQISAKSTTGNHSFKAFAPVAKKWDKQD